jgi:ankyrin repeat protein
MIYKYDNLDITLINENNETPLDLAIKLDRQEIIELLNNFNNEYTKSRDKRNIN